VTATAFFDIDGTLITESVWDKFLLHPKFTKGMKRAAYARFLPTFVGRKLGITDEVQFRQSWVEQMAHLVKGWQRTEIESWFDRVIYELMGDDCLRADVVARVKKHLAEGERVVLISGMYAGLADRYAKLLGAEVGLGTRLAYAGDICTGKIDGLACAGKQKPLFMREYLGQSDLSACFGYADSFSDVPMLSSVGHAVATYPDEKLKAVAVERGWEVIPT
jgi:HAD superfamily hydrolase (TIGR01490 family)